MVFSSSIFIFGFLPVVYLGFLISHQLKSRSAVLYWLIASSLCFYGWWNPRYLILIAVLIGANFGISRAIAAATAVRRRKCWLTLGLVLNIGTLIYYKYTNFLLDNVNTLAGTHLVIDTIVLPLGISFFTFQKIALLIDTYHGRVQTLAFGEYCLFVLFFPQLIAGPIVHHSEVVPQFRRLHEHRVNWDHVVLGLSIFFIGLFKKGRIRRYPGRRGCQSCVCRYRHRSGADIPGSMGQRARLYAGALLRFQRLLRYGHRSGHAVWDPPATEFQLALQGRQHHRILGAMASYPDTLSDLLYLQSTQP